MKRDIPNMILKDMSLTNIDQSFKQKCYRDDFEDDLKLIQEMDNFFNNKTKTLSKSKEQINPKQIGNGP